MKVLIVVDKLGSAINICANAMKKLADFIDYDIVAVHPKRPSTEQLEDFRKKAFEADIIDFQYWKSADMLLRCFPFLKDKKKILTHHNPYDVELEDWFEKYDEVIVKNGTQQKAMQAKFGKTPILVPHSIDMDKFKFQIEYPNDNVFKVMMVAARIESSKGIAEVAKACRETKTKFILVGKISDMDYMRQVVSEGGDYIDFRQEITDEELIKAYYESHIHICNSKDNFESGTLPILESMACGLPVLTRYIGLVPDLYNKSNMVVRTSDKEDWEDIAKKIKELKEDRKKRLNLREEAFKSILNRDYEYTARQYYDIYRKVLYKDSPLVSIVIPTYNRKDILSMSLISTMRQTYKNIEVIVVDDGSTDGTDEMVKDFRKESGMSLKYVRFENSGYGLARSRNTGLVESNGEIIVLIDDRLVMDRDAVENFVKFIRPRKWCFGDKGANKKSFVENFSAIYKHDLLSIGGFNERINCWGGATGDIRNKMSYTGIQALYCPTARCKPLTGTKSKSHRKEDLFKAKLLLWKLWRKKYA